MLYITISLLGGSLLALVWFPEPPLAYLAILLLGASTAIYLYPEKRGDARLSFSRSHGLFTFLRIENAISVPLTFVFVFAGIEAAQNSQWTLLGCLAILRIFPEIMLDGLSYLKRRELLSKTPPIESLSQVGEAPMAKVRGFVFETRTRRKRMNRTLFNVWLLDSSLEKLFVTGMTEIRGLTERVREGMRVSLVGPTTMAMGIKAVSPVAAVVLPPDWGEEDADWMDVLRRRLRLRRLLYSAFGSVVYLVTISVLSYLVSQFYGYADRTLSTAVFALLAAAFFWALGEKSAGESSSYDIRWYFEPRWSELSERAKANRLERLRHQAGSGSIHWEYVNLIEGADPGTI
jgi:hypothetical protein